MPLPAPQLDDRRAQDIVDEAKGLISRYCPEWTDHNVSDPGVALIELFAWMTELLLYRVNQVPDKLYIKFLELLGVTLQPPVAAKVAVTFYLSAAQPVDVTVKAGTEVATVRTEVSEAIFFTTIADLAIRVPTLLGAFTRPASVPDDAAWIAHDLRQLVVSEERAIPIWSARPAPGDAFYLALERDASNHVLALALECPSAEGTGVSPDNPPFEWQVWQGQPARWVPCVVERDGTRAFNREWGEIILRVPKMTEAAFQNRRAYWLRCRLTDAQSGINGYKQTPSIRKLTVEARGGTVGAEHATVVRTEVLGQSDGTPGQRFQLRHAPLLDRSPDDDYLEVIAPRRRYGLDEEGAAAVVERWVEVADFGLAAPEARHYTLDARDGLLALGPALPRPDGTLQGFGAVPEKGATLRFARYRHGGGVSGNVPAGTLTMLKSAIPYIYQVVNWQAASGGSDPQSLELAKLLAPQAIRAGDRAVTADDFEHYASQVDGVARARCLAAGAQPSADPNTPRPGQIRVVVLPRVADGDRPLTPEHLVMSAELRARIVAELDQRRLIGVTLDVRTPQYLWVTVTATIQTSSPLAEEICRRAESALTRYLDPYLGGPLGKGWPFGRELRVTELYGVLQRVAGVELIEDVQLAQFVSGATGRTQPIPARLALAPNAVICSGRHEVRAVITERV